MRKQTIILILFVHVFGLYGQEVVADTLYFSLEESLVFAMENNLNAENAKLDVDAADQRVWETAALGLPQVNASVNYNYNINLATTLIPDFLGDPSNKIAVKFGSKHYATAGFVGNQLIFSGEYIIGLQAAKRVANATTGLSSPPRHPGRQVPLWRAQSTFLRPELAVDGPGISEGA